MAFPHKDDVRLLTKMVVGPFYRENAGLLAVVLFICFGFFDSTAMMIAAHKGIMFEICSSFIVMTASLCVWSAYVFKTWTFVSQTLRDPRNECLHVMGLSAPWQSVGLWCLVYLPLSLPVTIYASFTVYVGLQSGYLGASFLILLFHVGVGLAWAVFFSVLQGQAHRRFVPALRWTLPFALPLPHCLYFGSHLVNERKLMLLVTKAISLLLLWGGFYLMRMQNLDVRFGLMCMVAATTAHLNIVIKMLEFEDFAMCWRKNLPFRPVELFLSYCLFFSLLLLPELLLVCKQVGTLLVWHQPLLFWSVGLSGLSLYHAMLYKKGMHHEKYMNQVFVVWLLLTFAIQFKLPPLVVTLIVATYAYWMYASRYHRYEKVVNSE